MSLTGTDEGLSSWMNAHSAMRADVVRNRCLTYVRVPHLGYGWVQACVSLLENFPHDVLAPTLVIPRAFQPILPSVTVKQAVPYPIPYRYAQPFVQPALDHLFRRLLTAADPRDTILYFWPAPPVSLLHDARKRGFLTVREMLNTCRDTAKAIMDDAYARLGLPARHSITSELVESEREELALYDFIFSANPRIERSLVESGVAPGKILRSSFGWSPSQFPARRADETREGFRALFIGSGAVRKGLPQLLAAWKKSGVVGELLVVGEIESALKPLVAPYLDGHGVRLQGFTYDLASLYKSADVFVFPSLEEGDPQVTYQAAGCGLPVIATPMGSANIIRHGINGLLVEPYDIDGLAEAIRRLANAPDLRKQLGQQAAKDAQQYTYERLGDERARILGGLLTAHAQK